MGPQKSRQMLAASSATLKNVQIEWRCRKYWGLTWGKIPQVNADYSKEASLSPPKATDTRVLAEHQCDCGCWVTEFQLNMMSGWLKAIWVHSPVLSAAGALFTMASVCASYRCGAAFSSPLILPLPLPNLGYFKDDLGWPQWLLHI